MYILITYDVEAKRTRQYLKVLSRYLTHEQNSVFGGNMTEATLLKLHRDLARIASGADRIFQVEAESRHNVSVTILRRAEGNAVLERIEHDHHRTDSVVL
jgi:CRISPR-associated protein Cas2